MRQYPNKDYEKLYNLKHVTPLKRKKYKKFVMPRGTSGSMYKHLLRELLKIEMAKKEE